MRRLWLTTWTPIATCLVATALAVGSGPQSMRSNRTVDAAQAIETFSVASPGAHLDWQDGRISRVYGRAFATGPSAFHSASSFVDDHAAIFGVPVEDLAASGPFADGRHMQPIMYQQDTGTYKFTGCFYTQVRDGVPVFRARLNLLCRNEADHPVVLAAADLRDLGAFAPDVAAAQVDLPRLSGVAANEFGPGAEATRAHAVIFAGANGDDHAPTLAFETYVSINDADRWLLVIEAGTDAVLLREHRVHFFDDVSGTVRGMVTQGIEVDVCEPEEPTRLPYVEVRSGPYSVFADVEGNYTIPTEGTDIATVSAWLDGEWFTVFDSNSKMILEETIAVGPPGPGDFLLNATNTYEEDRSAVNVYLAANLTRDYALKYNPGYPTLDEGGFPVHVNRHDMYCPANAWYDPEFGGSLNFCASTPDYPNMGWSSIAYHEYGHHLIAAAGSGQGAYGEGMSDAIAALLQRDSRLITGFFECGEPIRNAINEWGYPCFGQIHDCGGIVSGCVWDTRQALIDGGFDDYEDIIGALTVNSILLHTGEDITPQITIDFLTLDDDNADIMDGTPHYTQIQAGFSNHNMAGPDLDAVLLMTPAGVPERFDPSGSDTFLVTVTPFTQNQVPGSGLVHVGATGAPGSYTAVPMTELAPNVYEAQLPPGVCGAGVQYYVTVDLEFGGIESLPAGGADEPLSAVYATDIVTTFADDFEADLDWTVTNDDDLTDGAWDRGVPAGGGDRGDPPTDADGSGQCYLTDNVDGNSDVDGGGTTLTSPVMDATVGTPFVSYWRWYSNDTGLGTTQDTMVIEVNDGTGWVHLETVGPDGPDVSGGWFYRQFRIEDFVSLTDQFQVRFTVADLETGTIIEAGVDGISLDAVACADQCAGDTTGDGQVNDADLVEVITAWGTTGPHIADVNGDLVVNVNDIVALMLEWGSCE